MDYQKILDIFSKESSYLSCLPLELLDEIRLFVDGKKILQLASLLPIPDTNFIFLLARNSVIAGASVLYALCGDPPDALKENIKVYLFQKDSVANLIQKIEKWASKNNLKSKFYLSVKRKDRLCIRLGRPGSAYGIIKLILTDFTTVKEIIENKAIDYLQCAFFRGRFIQTDACRKAISKKEIFETRYYWVPDTKRISAIVRGFKILPLFHRTPDREECLLKTVDTPCLVPDRRNPLQKKILNSLNPEWGGLEKDVFHSGGCLVFGIHIQLSHIIQKQDHDEGVVDRNDPWFSFFSVVHFTPKARQLSSAYFDLPSYSCLLFAKFSKGENGLVCSSDGYMIGDQGFLPKDLFLT